MTYQDGGETSAVGCSYPEANGRTNSYQIQVTNQGHQREYHPREERDTTADRRIRIAEENRLEN
jgi:hypothetical protein